MNKVVLVGRLATDPELRKSKELSIVKFSIAVNRRKKEDPADFFWVTAFGKQADVIAQYLHKGDGIAVTGRIQNDKYTKKDGTTGFSTQIIAEEFDFTGGKKQDAAQQPAAGQQVDDDGFMNIPDGVDDEELPFN